MTMRSGASASATALPSRRNSGFIAKPTLARSRPLRSSTRGSTSSSVVRGRTVDFTMTTCSRSPPASASPMAAAADSTCAISIEPSSRDGVPTQMNVKSAALILSAISPEPRSFPDASPAARSSGSPGSKIGHSPALSAATRSGRISRHATSWPEAASVAPVTSPT